MFERREKDSYSVADWIRRWDETMWSNEPWRKALIVTLEEIENKLKECRVLKTEVSQLTEENKKQTKYIEYLERQVILLQKTLDVVERLGKGDNNG